MGKKIDTNITKKPPNFKHQYFLFPPPTLVTLVCSVWAPQQSLIYVLDGKLYLRGLCVADYGECVCVWERERGGREALSQGLPLVMRLLEMLCHPATSGCDVSQQIIIDHRAWFKSDTSLQVFSLCCRDCGSAPRPRTWTVSVGVWCCVSAQTTHFFMWHVQMLNELNPNPRKTIDTVNNKQISWRLTPFYQFKQLCTFTVYVIIAF